LDEREGERFGAETVMDVDATTTTTTIRFTALYLDQPRWACTKKHSFIHFIHLSSRVLYYAIP